MSDLTTQTRAWIETQTGSPVLSATKLDGATTASVHRIDLADGRILVAKVFDQEDFLDERPDRADHEAAMLDLLEPTPVPAPRLVAVDGVGEAAGVPTVLMTWVEGTTELPDGWVMAMAENIADIHRVDPGGITWPYERYNEGFELAAPSWAGDPGIWSEAFAIATSPPATATGFIHRDYHGGNLLWHQGDLAGVLDWLSGCIGPRAIDLAHLRMNLAMDYGLDEAEAVLDEYLELGEDGAWHPAWDVVDAIDFLPYWFGLPAVEEWTWDGRPPAETQARFDRILSDAVRASYGSPQ